MTSPTLPPDDPAQRRAPSWDPDAGDAAADDDEIGFFAFLWQNKLWWIVPCVVILALFAIAVYFTGGEEGSVPFFYTLND